MRARERKAGVNHGSTIRLRGWPHAGLGKGEDGLFRVFFSIDRPRALSLSGAACRKGLAGSAESFYRSRRKQRDDVGGEARIRLVVKTGLWEKAK